MNIETRRAKILIVDDTPANVTLLTDLLEFYGYLTIQATSGHEALDQLKRDTPDLILLDVKMPKMSGYEVCKRIREQPDTALLPVIMMTAFDPVQERIHGIEAGADDFLTQPINQQELLARVSLAAAGERASRHGTVPGCATFRVEQDAGATGSGAGVSTGSPGATQALFLPSTRRSHRGGRCCRPAQEPPSRGHGGIH